MKLSQGILGTVRYYQFLIEENLAHILDFLKEVC